MPCTIEVAANGVGQVIGGLPTRLVVYARLTGTCNRVRFRVLDSPTGGVLFSSEAVPDVNGTCSSEFVMLPGFIGCGAPLWIEAQCIADGTCGVAQTVYLKCKEPSTGPPIVFCPFVARLFTQTLLLAWGALLMGVALLNATVIVAALATIVADFGVLGVWRQICQPHVCHVRGAVLWAAKRCVLLGVLLLLMSRHVPMVTVLWLTGIIAGVLTGRLRKDNCPIPSVRTPLNQLPLW